MIAPSAQTARPLIVVLQDEPDELASVLRPRFARDYDVRTCTTMAQLLRLVDADASARVALVLADWVVDEVETSAALGELRHADPDVMRCILIPAGERTAARRMHTAVAGGCADRTLRVPWGHPEVELYPVVSTMLGQWWCRVAPDEAAAVQLTVVAPAGHPRLAEMRDLADRNNVPTRFLLPDEPDGERMLAEAEAAPNRVVIAAPGKAPLVDPKVPEIGALVGARLTPPAPEWDLVIVGAGPAGLAAAVYGASEGLATLMLEKRAVGGQAGTSSAIRNYPGFPYGVSGADLASAMIEQAWILGAESVYRGALAIQTHPEGHRIYLDGGSQVTARAIVLSMGVSYRQLHAPGVERLQGAGVYYGAARAEARGVSGQDVYIVGRGNSAGQAAVHLAQYARQVTILIRGASLAASMSEYLLREIDRTANIRIHTHAEVAEAHGDQRLEALTLRAAEGEVLVGAAGLFIMIGAQPDTGWLPAAIARDEYGYVLTGDNIRGGASFPYETSVPGIFAVGDLRRGAVKRVASAVGEGAVSMVSIHRHLARPRRAAPVLA